MTEFEAIRKSYLRWLRMGLAMGGLALIASIFWNSSTEEHSGIPFVVAFFGLMITVMVYTRITFHAESPVQLALESGQGQVWAFCPFLIAYLLRGTGDTVTESMIWAAAWVAGLPLVIGSWWAVSRIQKIEEERMAKLRGLNGLDPGNGA